MNQPIQSTLKKYILSYTKEINSSFDEPIANVIQVVLQQLIIQKQTVATATLPPSRYPYYSISNVEPIAAKSTHVRLISEQF